MSRIVIVGGGVAGLSTAYHLLKTAKAGGRPLSVTLLEAAPRLGGKIITEKAAGFLVEGGPDSFISLKPEAITLCEELGMADELVRTNDARQRTFILCRGVLEPIPDGMETLVPSRLLPFLRTRLLSPAGKARLALEPLMKTRRDGADESVADFVERRLGREFYERIAEPLLSGIFSGDARTLSLRSSFPQLALMEENHGSLLKAVLARRRAPAVPRTWSTFVTVRGGMGRLVERLASVIALEGAEVRTEAPVDSVERAGEGWRLRAGGGMIEADGLVLAVPAYEAERLLRGVDDRLAAELSSVRYNPAATVSFAYEKDPGHPLEGFGFVVPRAEGRVLLACTWTSSKYPDRAPEGGVLLRAYFGGGAAAHWQGLDDRALARLAQEELRETMGLSGEPLLTRVFRWDKAMPQYGVGHRRWLDGVEGLVEGHPGLELAGAPYRGVGIPDCIKDGARASQRLMAQLAAKRP